MKVIDIIRNGVKIRITQTAFCMGIGLDQFTPQYHVTITESHRGFIYKKVDPIKVDIHKANINTKSLQKNNYGRRVIQKGK